MIRTTENIYSQSHVRIKLEKYIDAHETYSFKLTLDYSNHKCLLLLPDPPALSNMETKLRLKCNGGQPTMIPLNRFVHWLKSFAAPSITPPTESGSSLDFD